ncbi:hypothetical protein OPS25_07935 [Alteromonas ponticola]|uniref:DUF4235 domain-containing protein n=1 Tax=Alteromonas aquimaris TaxID=2998417 RepID=A0ABT3P8K4_9ALTE|nr:hypothetical protein [Alteromonas aquimaris]MCW8108421.1 hypothetical protein [Alteromonas aquimaris]
MMGLGTKSLVAYQLFRMLKQKTRKVEQAVASEPLSVATQPPSLTALTATAYSVSKLTKYEQLQRFLFKATISTAIAGLISSSIQALTNRKRDDDDRVIDAANEVVDGPADNAAAIAAVSGTIPNASGPLLAASAAGYAASAILDKSKKRRGSSRLSKVLIGGCIGFAAAHLVKKLESPVSQQLDNRPQEDVDDFNPDKPYIPKKMEPILDSWGGPSQGH